MALALKHCHDKRILHRDLKSQNIFLTSKNFVKLGDFGIAKVLEHTMDKAHTIVGTPFYLSPEIIDGSSYSFAADIWSLGIILYEMCALKPPFTASSLSALGMKILKGNYQPIPSQYSRELHNLVGLLLNPKPQKRPSIKKLLSISLCSNAIENELINTRIHEFLDEVQYKMEFEREVLHKKAFFPAPAQVSLKTPERKHSRETKRAEESKMSAGDAEEELDFADTKDTLKDIKLRGVTEDPDKIRAGVRKIREMQSAKGNLFPPQKGKYQPAKTKPQTQKAKDKSPKQTERVQSPGTPLMEDFKASQPNEIAKPLPEEKKSRAAQEIDAVPQEDMEEDVNKLSLYLIEKDYENHDANTKVDQDMHNMVNIMQKTFRDLSTEEVEESKEEEQGQPLQQLVLSETPIEEKVRNKDEPKQLDSVYVVSAVTVGNY
eukprot:TRINITY_DN848_c0_g1_i6.p1 TRINITY_DN848_c0_g1~~TRINITY_DN848_c0_g1_i6.p1  ORF type:complete len:433 (+),score=137.90 TRINITY_DN848_c0_g1_i6:419-1717(+)